MHTSPAMAELCRKFRHEYAGLICCIPALGGFSYGFTFALNGLIVVQDSFINHFCVGTYGDHESCYKLTTAAQLHDWVAFKTQFVATLILGAMLGTMLSTLISERMGRRANITLYSTLYVASTLWCILHPSIPHVLTARVLMGIATGGLSMILPVYLSEISSASSRGRTAALLPITLNCSLLFAALVAQCVASDTAHGWQWAYLWGLPPSAAISVGVWCAPESPRWLLVHKGRGSAARALQKLRGAGADISAELGIMEARLAAQRTEGAGQSPWALVFSPSMLPRLRLICTLQWLAHLSGVSALLNFAPTILEEAGVSNKFLATLACYTCNLLGCLIAVKCIDLWGRRRLLLMGTSVMLLGLMGAAAVDLRITWGHSHDRDTTWAGYAFVGFLGCYFLAFAGSFGAVLWVLPAEVFPSHVRTKAVSLGSLVHFSATYLAAYTLELLFYLGVGGALVCFAFVTSLLLYYVVHRVPETAGKSLEEIDLLFPAPHPPVPGHEQGQEEEEGEERQRGHSRAKAWWTVLSPKGQSSEQVPLVA